MAKKPTRSSGTHEGLPSTSRGIDARTADPIAPRPIAKRACDAARAGMAQKRRDMRRRDHDEVVRGAYAAQND